MATTPLFFRVCFEGMTDRAREFWAERRYVFARDLLVDGFNLTETKALEVLGGKKKMVDHPKGTAGVDGTLVTDSWKPKSGLFYPDPKRGVAYAEASLARHLAEVENTRLKEELDELCSARVKEEHDQRVLDAFVVKEFDKEARGLKVQKPDRTFKSDWGWLLPDGKFYPCGEQEHIWLAGVLRKQLDLVEKSGVDAERASETGGWLKLGSNDRTVYIFADMRPTQRQLDTLFDWAMKKSRRQRGFDQFMELQINR